MNTREFAKPADQLQPASEALIEMSLPATDALLVHQLLNESLNGIRGILHETQIGMSEAALRSIFDEFNVWIEARDYDADGIIVIRDDMGVAIGSFFRMYSQAEIRALRNMTEVVMLDLGRSEFFTRTGFSLPEAKQLLDRLNAILLESLHLNKQTEPVAH
jgi:hypothetical protein